ncbi:MAG: alkaline phosphatase family protein [Pirellulales bacterium]|nr:alkaline phosphatase family protein [Pirellulales bacterium]
MGCRAVLFAGGFCAALATACLARADKRVLVIGIDGAGGSYFEAANTPNIDALVAKGSARFDWLNEAALAPNPPEGYGASGVNWSTITTGASAAHHGVTDNSFTGSRYDQYPHFFKYIEQQKPELFTASIVDWAPINDLILGSGTADLALGGISDNAVRDATVNLMQTGNPHAVFLHFDQVDAAGHGIGWGTGAYYTALANVDALVGNIMGALNARPGVGSGVEDWLVMVTADHGGEGTSHFASQGLINWKTPFVISGPSVPDGIALQQGTLRDVATTALWHLGIDPFSTAVDGNVVGIPFGSPNGVVGDVNQDGVVSGNGKGPLATDDVTAFVAGWMTRGHASAPAAYMHGDLNLDRVTDLRDWIILNRLNPAMGQAALAGLAVPEPAAWILAGVGIALVARRRRMARPPLGRSRSAQARITTVVAVMSGVAACVGLGEWPCDAAIVDDLIGLYQFEDAFLDTSGSPTASHGIPVGSPQFAPGKIGQAMQLTGVQDYLSLPQTAELDFGTTTDFSLSMWIRQDDFLSDPAVLSNKNWNSGDNVGINWAVKGNGIFDLNTKAGGGARRDLDTAANSASLGVGAWSQVTMTVDRDGATKLYINGVNTGTIPVTSQGSFNGSLPWNIGQDGTGEYGVEFTGAVDELAIWRRAITSAEATQLYNNGAGLNLGSLVVESRLKLVIDRTTGDIAIQNNTGQPQNLIGYQIKSESGVFNRAAWTPIAGRLDGSGSGAVDQQDWVVLTAPNSAYDLSEAALGLGTIAGGGRIDLGHGVWTRYFEDLGDVEFLYADGVGDEPLSGLVEFRGNGGASYLPGDLNFDGFLDSDDWLTLAGGFGGSLANLSAAARYRRGDLDNDGAHSLDDVAIFRQQYDAVHGAGALAAMLRTIPEPTGMALLGVCAAGVLAVRPSGRSRRCRAVLALALAALFTSADATAVAAVLFQQNFDGLALGPHVDETTAGSNVWTNAPPAAWSIDNAGVPGGGVTEWRGWAFTDPTWWATTAADQGRSQFTKGAGVVAVADPDEWDDLPRNAGTYNSFLRTPTISLVGVGAGAGRLGFDSSWLPEDTQTATITASYNGGPAVEVMRWTSVTGDGHFKPGNTNETVVVPLNNPAGATSVRLSFGMTNAENDWWWAIDNVRVFTPLTLQVDVQTGGMQLLGDASVAITGYEISSLNGSLNPSGWKAGNLDAQNVGAPKAAAADFNGVGGVTGDDLGTWNAALGVNSAADADKDGDSDGADFLRWQRQWGATADPGSTWLTLLAANTKLIESYLLGSSTFAAGVSLGSGYNTDVDARDLAFSYTTSAGDRAAGFVTYTNLPAAQAAPEPAGLQLAPLALALLAGTRRRRG